ncbi:uncharacterized protein MYCGRDRAFT_106678 [Zymoseptoria tritici IPO323]|uniref:Uncharacterized protein n=1 Tax=Zymoseptoria tritici (strain CBS 115943 / IPO323) TaxID=336722 RepID=F9XRU7_ZYMTI|nr:uncharacterized protein MYCGRDRAFT_106678 [Zymoseptoria tritici IPO323]EGP82035.1 hypothetical protein MYCGRDRAFT_106678 [Zymoseptoria tritici IPO323]
MDLQSPIRRCSPHLRRHFQRRFPRRLIWSVIRRRAAHPGKRMRRAAARASSSKRHELKRVHCFFHSTHPHKASQFSFSHHGPRYDQRPATRVFCTIHNCPNRFCSPRPNTRADRRGCANVRKEDGPKEGREEETLNREGRKRDGSEEASHRLERRTTKSGGVNDDRKR